MLAAPSLIDRPMTNYWAGVSGKGNRIIPRWRPYKKRKGHLSPRSETNVYHLPPSRHPLFLIGHHLLILPRIWRVASCPAASTWSSTTSSPGGRTSLPSRKFYFHILLKKMSNNENVSDDYCFNKNLEILNTSIINEAMSIVFFMYRSVSFMYCALRFPADFK